MLLEVLSNLRVVERNIKKALLEWENEKKSPFPIKTLHAESLIEVSENVEKLAIKLLSEIDDIKNAAKIKIGTNK